MKNIISLFILFVLSATLLHSQVIEGTCYELLKPSPWAQSMIISDTSAIDYELKKNSGVRIKLIEDWSRFAPDYKGENYKETEIKVDSKASFKIDFSKVRKDKLIVISAYKEGFIKLWYTLRMDKFPFTNKVKLIMVPIINVN